MIIKNGVNDKPTKINIQTESDFAQIWIEQEGLSEVRETLAYATIQELLELKKEIDEALKKLCKL